VDEFRTVLPRLPKPVKFRVSLLPAGASKAWAGADESSFYIPDPVCFRKKFDEELGSWGWEYLSEVPVTDENMGLRL